MHIRVLRATWSGASIPTAPYAKGNLNLTGPAKLARANFASLQASPQRIARCDDVAKKLSRLLETAGKEESHRHG